MTQDTRSVEPETEAGKLHAEVFTVALVGRPNSELSWHEAAAKANSIVATIEAEAAERALREAREQLLTRDERRGIAAVYGYEAGRADALREARERVAALDAKDYGWASGYKAAVLRALGEPE